MKKDFINKKFELFIDQKWLRPKEKGIDALVSLCSNKEEADLIFCMLKKFKYFDADDLRASFLHAIEHMRHKWCLDPDKTQVVAIAQDSLPDSSQAMLQRLKPRLSECGWEGFALRSSINKIHKDAERYPNIVLFDEFAGTGKTLQGKIRVVRDNIRRHEKNISNKIPFKIYVCVLVAMEDVRELITPLANEFCEDYEPYYAGYELKKGISNNFQPDQVAEQIQYMKNIEGQLNQGARSGDYNEFPSLGYGEAETLYALMEENIPNSVFPIFWWSFLANGKKYDPLFFRYG